MKICPKCKKKIGPSEHAPKYADLPIYKSGGLSQIHCSCGYYGLPLEVKKKKNSLRNSKKI